MNLEAQKQSSADVLDTVKKASEYFFSGLLALNKGDLNQAESDFLKALELVPDRPSVLTNLSIVYAQQNKLAQALELSQKAVSKDPGEPLYFLQRGAIQLKLRDYNGALISLGIALEKDPSLAEAHYNRGSVLKELNRAEEALASYDKAIGLKPDHAEAFSNRGAVLKELNRLDEALASYDKAIGLKPDYAEAYSNRGNTLADLKRLHEALENYDKAIQLNPGSPEAYSNRGVLLRELHRPEEALASYDKAIGLKSDYAEGHYHKALLLLAEQHFQEGFSLYPWRWKTKDVRSRPLNTSIPLWNRNSSQRKLLLWAEQGVGDEILYSSMIPLISDDVAITLSADKRLHSVYERSFPHIEVIDRAFQKQAVDSGYDAQAAIGDLGRILGVSGGMIKQRRYPFLLASEMRAQSLLKNNEFMANRPVCGIAWKSANKILGREKSISLPELDPLLRTAGITFVNLQYGDVTDEIDQVAEEIGTEVHQVKDLDVFNDIDGLLSLIHACDIVLTTSNVTAHLAGAIGKKAAVLVPAGRGRIWYWHDQQRSIWYPSLRLFTQSNDWNWRGAIFESAKWIKDNI